MNDLKPILVIKKKNTSPVDASYQNKQEPLGWQRGIFEDLTTGLLPSTELSASRILARKPTLISPAGLVNPRVQPDSNLERSLFPALRTPWNTGVTHYRPSNHQTGVFSLPQIWFGHLTPISDSLVYPSAFDCSLPWPIFLPGKRMSTKTEKDCVQTSHPDGDFVMKGKLLQRLYIYRVKLTVIL